MDGNLYLFDGIGKNSEGLTQVFNDVHKYNLKTNSWVKLMSHAPMGMAGHVTFVHNGKAYVTCGVNQNIFNGYFEDLNEARKDSTYRTPENWTTTPRSSHFSRGMIVDKFVDAILQFWRER
ncbi:TPA: N-acetylneuraminate epimerase [Escherichia coli]|nr:N-acetylneuraminate epimerase [Escherichia coli]EFF2147439.1 N-acetylneuraminate epimerase [Escherichia coli]EFF2192882.1 N-acetylneuraminate epimerase [Escherichia coli]EFG3070100.1 N-acetylneuraminate epimerase [Escherichia coli]EFG9295774.1 N-acetylneuraminate epimerase [Escherichia coli]